MLEKIKRINISTLLLIVTIIFVILYLHQCNRNSNLKDKLEISKMNQIALNDTISTYESRNGTLVYEKSILIASKKELKDLNRDLYDEVKDLKKNPKIIFKENIVVKHDTTRLETKIVRYPDGSIGLNWNRDTTFSKGNFQKLAGETRFKLDSNGVSTDVITSLNTNEFGISFTTGLTKGKDTYEIFIKSDYPGFTVTDIQGAIIDKDMIMTNESSIVFGPSIGYGGVINNTGFHNGVIIGVTATWNLNKRIKKIFSPFGL